MGTVLYSIAKYTPHRSVFLDSLPSTGTYSHPQFSPYSSFRLLTFSSRLPSLLAAISAPFAALMATGIQAVVWDVDGTLLDTEPLYFECYGLAANKLGHAYSFDIHQHILGRAEREGAATVLRMLGVDSLTPDAFLELRDTFMLERMPHVDAMPGAASAVASLAAALPMAVATSAKREYFEPKTRKHAALFSSMKAVICGDDPAVGGKSKPDPSIFLAAAAALGVAPSACVAVEDSIAGIMSAKSAGMFVVAVPDPRLDAAAVAAAAPDVTLRSLEDFEQVTRAILSGPK
jgi:pseudouridine 5'-phosphatase